MNVLGGFNEVFRDVFDDEDLEVYPEMTANDVEAWDSLNHMLLITSIEDKFDITFSDDEIISFQNVGAMIQAVEAKVG